MKSLYIYIPNESTWESVIISAYVSPWLFSFPNGIIPKYEQAKKNYHGNSKLLLHLFFNDITRKYEIVATTASTEKSYPHIKTIKVVEWKTVNYDLCCAIFGRK